MKWVGRALRLLAGGQLAWWVLLAVQAPETPRIPAIAALFIAALTLWRADLGLLGAAAVIPVGSLLAPAPVRVAELLAWAFLAGWLLQVWRPLSAARWPRFVTIPAALYLLAVFASWLTLSIGSAAGVPAARLPEFLLALIPRDHLTWSTPEPETWTMLQTMTGVAMLLAGTGITAGDTRRARAVAWTVATSMAVLAGVTFIALVSEWAEAGYPAAFLLRYVQGERYSAHLVDFNAAASLDVLGGSIVAAIALLDARRRALSAAALLPILGALWLTGSRSAYLAALGSLVVVAIGQRRKALTRMQLAASMAVLVAVLLAGAAIVDWDSEARGSAGLAASLRTEFTATSARMLASAPMFGVGIGHYFDRSAEFMSPQLRAIYGNENAHNYFLQQFAELGVVGGLLFVWLVVAVIGAGWRAVRGSDLDPALLGLLAGTIGYVLTCVTGHPLLVPEAAFGFWAAAGALSAARPQAPVTPLWDHPLVAAVCVVLAAGVAPAVAAYAGATTMPADSGFHGMESDERGIAFRWMTRHAVTYIPNGTGFLRLRVQGPGYVMSQPLMLQTAVAGRTIHRQDVSHDEWKSFEIPIRGEGSAEFRRVDFRVNQQWMQEVPLGRRRARRPITLRVAEIRWIPLD